MVWSFLLLSKDPGSARLHDEADEEAGDYRHVRVQVRQHRAPAPLPTVCR